MRVRWLIGLWLLVSFLIGFAQEYIKVNVNYHIEEGMSIPGYFEKDARVRKELLDARSVYAPFDYYYSHAPMDVLHHLGLRELQALKWGVTVLFAVLFWWLNHTLLRLLTGDEAVLRWHRNMYIVLFVFSFVIYLAGKAIGYPAEFYAVSRKIVGALQSLVPMMFLYPAWYLYHRTKHTHETT